MSQADACQESNCLQYESQCIKVVKETDYKLCVFIQKNQFIEKKISETAAFPDKILIHSLSILSQLYVLSFNVNSRKYTTT